MVRHVQLAVVRGSKKKKVVQSKRSRHAVGDESSKNDNVWQVGQSVDVLFEGQWFNGKISDVKRAENRSKTHQFFPDHQVLFLNIWYKVSTEEVPAGVKCYFDDGSKHVVPWVRSIPPT